MDGAGPVCIQCGDVVGGAVPDMLIESVVGILVVVTYHVVVSDDFGEDGRRFYRRNGLVRLYNGLDGRMMP